MRSHRTIDATLAANHDDGMKSEKEGLGQTRWSVALWWKRRSSLLSISKTYILTSCNRQGRRGSEWLSGPNLPSNLNRRRSIENGASTTRSQRTANDNGLQSRNAYLHVASDWNGLMNIFVYAQQHSFQTLVEPTLHAVASPSFIFVQKLKLLAYSDLSKVPSDDLYNSSGLSKVSSLRRSPNRFALFTKTCGLKQSIYCGASLAELCRTVQYYWPHRSVFPTCCPTNRDRLTFFHPS